MLTWLLPLVVAALVGHTSSYRIVIDLNTYDSADMAFAASGQLSCDGVWAVNVNSPGVSPEEW